MFWIPYSLIITATASLWLTKNKNIHTFLIIASLVAGVNYGAITIFGLVIISCLYICILLLKRNFIYPVKFILGLLIIIISLALIGHIMPDFHNVKYLDAIKITNNAVPYTLYLNFDKPFVGLLLLYATNPLITNLKGLEKIISKEWHIFITAGFVLIICSYLFGYVVFTPKIPSFTYLWIIINLMSTITEEVFFRFFLQRNLQQILGKKFKSGEMISLIIIAVLFGLAHYMGGIKYIILSIFAGYFYGYIFYKTKRIEASILLHMFVNTVHFLLFTYPALA